MIFVQIYIKILGFGQKSILMRVDLFEIILSEISEICFIFQGFVGLWQEMLVISFLKVLLGLYTALWQPFLYQNPNSTGCSTISCISLWFIGLSQKGQALVSLETNVPQLLQTTWGKIRKTRHSVPASTSVPQTGQTLSLGENRLLQVVQTK